MRNLLAFLSAATLTVIAVGWYLDWFSLRSVPAEAGHRSWTVDMNTEKIGRDLIEAEKKVQKKLAEKSAATNKKPEVVPAKPADPFVKPAEELKFTGEVDGAFGEPPSRIRNVFHGPPEGDR